MKKLLLFASAVILSAACSSDNDPDNNSNSNSSKITPPAWIQGTWIMEDVPSYGYKFYNDDFCQIVNGNENCMKTSIDVYQGTNVYTNVEQSISNTEYKCTITIVAQKLNFHFQKVSDGVIKDVNMSNSTGTTVLFKRQ